MSDAGATTTRAQRTLTRLRNLVPATRRRTAAAAEADAENASRGKPAAELKSDPAQNGERRVSGRRRRSALGDITNNAPAPSEPATKRRRPTTRASLGKATAPEPEPAATDAPAAAGGAAASGGDSAVQMDDVEMVLETDELLDAPVAFAPPARPTLPDGVLDLEAAHLADPQYCSEYALELLESLRQSEQRHRASDSYIADVQSDLTPHIRAMVVDWVSEVAQEYAFHPRTLFLAVNLIDRALSRFAVRRSRLQLLSCSCMLLASKYEEIYAREVEDFVFISDNTYTKEDMLGMEQRVLNALSFCLSNATAHDFLLRFLRASEASETEEQLAEYLAELSLVHYQFLAFRPSLVAASCVFVARSTLRCATPWTPTLEHHTGYSLKALERCARALRAVHAEEPSTRLTAVRHKFNTTKTLHVARLPAAAGLSFTATN